MDYRFLMLADPKEIKRILDEFGGRSANKAAHYPGWVLKLLTLMVGTMGNGQHLADKSNTSAKKKVNDDEQPVHPQPSSDGAI